MSSEPTSSSLFVVTGGARGITARCVLGMAERYRCRFLLLGRTSIHEAEPAWAHGCDDAQELHRRLAATLSDGGNRASPVEVGRMVSSVLARREIGRTLDAVSQAGGRPTYAAVDIADREELRRTLAGSLGPDDRVTGLIHAAGVLADKPIERKSLDDFDRVYAPKVRGLANLLACIPPETLRHLILFSSAAAFYGNPGQADYALTNEILNKAAYRLKASYPSCRVLAIDWGPWDGGMVTPELRRLFSARGVQLIDAGDGVQAFLAMLSGGADSPQVLAGHGMRASSTPQPERETATYTLRRHLTVDANPFLRDHIIDSRPVLPAVCAATWIAHACEELYPGYYATVIEDLAVLKGIVFDEGLAEEYIVDLTEARHDDGEIVCEGRVWSQTAQNGTSGPSVSVRYHYRARVTLRRDRQEGPVDAGPDLSTDGKTIDGESLYGGRVLFHGPAFQGVRRVLRADHAGLTLECRLPPVAPADQGQFPVRSLNPFISDVQLQSQVIWSRLFQGAMSLPMRGGRYDFYRPIAFDQTFYVTLHVRSADTHRTVADITSYDAEGRVCMRIVGSETTCNPRLGQGVEMSATS